MSSVFAWLDFDDRTRRQMMDIVDLFREKGTLDELGIGQIRDTFADLFFPGTSTIQTRARYFLFLPWIYLEIERDRVSSARAPMRARNRQYELVKSLIAGGVGANAGVIGIDAGRDLKRLPASVYWYGLYRWGIRLFNGSVEQYHASLDAINARDRAAKLADSGELLDPEHRSWDGSLPAPPPGWLDSTTFQLRPIESDYLSEQIALHAPESLLAACVRRTVRNQHRARYPWDLTGIDAVAPELRARIRDARNFSLVMEGAALLYNLMLAERSSEQQLRAGSELIDRYRGELDRWAAEMSGEGDELATWDLSQFWNAIRERNPKLPHPAFMFANTFVGAAQADPGGVPNSALLRNLISVRERQLKGGLARLHNPRALERWSGEAGLGRLSFRWPSAQTILTDIHRGRSSGDIDA